ncbi:MAG: sulfatase-like hydrolase/transferase [Bacteroidetes bacterium]|jgi:arylsulfatase A|nr:sulfatase-like hydrolase/transferase [Bacteroidota bacterium]
MKLRIFLLAVLFANTALLAQTKKPNIIYILADDLGIDGLSCYGADLYKTPVIDKLAKDGIRYTNAYTAPLCGPSRALILTGRYAFRTGAVNQDMTGDMSPSVETMMPKILKQAGYTSSMIGKWGQLPLGPAEFGFDDYLRFFGSGVYVSTTEKKQKYVLNGQESILKDNEYMPDLMHTHVEDFLSKHTKDPFYMYYSMVHVHGEIIATPDTKPGTTDFKSLYTDNINYMDKLVGKLLRTLDSLKLRDNTLIVFMGDNGTAGQAAAIGTVNGKKIIGKKGTMQEGGSLVPLIVNWPNVVKKGTVSKSLIDATDLIPTFAEIAGAPLPTNNILDGKSFAYQLKGTKGVARDWIFTELGNDWYVRSANWKLNRAGQLFDMRNAPFEEKEVAIDDTNKAEKDKLQMVLDSLNPAGGILDKGDGSGRHATKVKAKNKGKEQ